MRSLPHGVDSERSLQWAPNSSSSEKSSLALQKAPNACGLRATSTHRTIAIHRLTQPSSMPARKKPTAPPERDTVCLRPKSRALNSAHGCFYGSGEHTYITFCARVIERLESLVFLFLKMMRKVSTISLRMYPCGWCRLLAK